MVSIGIAVHNEEGTIRKVLERWLEEPVKEIIVVSSGSVDRTDYIIKNMKDKRIKLIIEKERKGKPSAVNIILQKAKYDLIMTDADVFPVKGCAEKLMEHFKDKKVGLVAGHPVPIRGKGMLDYWTKLSFDLIHQKRLENIELDVTGNLYALRKGIVKKIPLNVMLDDTYVALNVKRTGYSIVYEPSAKVQVGGVGSLDIFIKQKTRTRVGWYQIRFNEKIKVERSIGSGIIRYFPRTIRNLFTLKGIIYMPLYYFFSVVVWLNARIKWKQKKDILDIWKRTKS